MLLWRRLRMDAAGEEGAGASRAPAVLDFGEMHATLDAFLRRFDRYVPVSYTHLTLPTICSV